MNKILRHAELTRQLSWANYFVAEVDRSQEWVDEIVSQAERVASQTDDLSTANQQQTG